MALPDMKEGLEETLLELIRDAMRNHDVELLLGVQSLAGFTVWTGFQGVEVLINVLFERSLKMYADALELEAQIAEHDGELREMGLYDKRMQDLAMLQARRLPLVEVSQAMGGIRKMDDASRVLTEQGFIDLQGRDVHDMTIALTDLWDGTIEETHRRGTIRDTFPSELGTMIALGIAAKYRGLRVPQGYTTLMPIIFALTTHPTGEMTFDELSEEYVVRHLEFKKLANSIVRDARKVEELRMLAFNDGRVIRFGRNTIRAVDLWVGRAQDYLRGLGMGP